MKKKIRIATVLVILPIATFFFYAWGRDTNWSYFYRGVDEDALEQSNWKSLEGGIGDFLYFRGTKWPDGIIVDHNYNIYFDSVRKGRVINATADRLTVEDLKGRHGYYDCK